METFEQMIRSDYFKIPVVNTEKFIKESEVKFSSIEFYLKKRPKVFLDTETLKRVVLCKINREISFQDALDYVKSKNGIFPNAEGLSIASPLVRFFVKTNKAIFGFDEKSNLWNPSQNDESFLVPFVSKKEKGFYFGLSSFGKNVQGPKTTGSYLIYFSD